MSIKLRSQVIARDMLKIVEHFEKDKKKRLVIGLLLLTLGVIGCAHEVRIETDPPGARVRIVSENGKSVTPLGSTPASVDSLKAGKLYLLELEKEGFMPQYILVNVLQGAKIKVAIKLQQLSKEFIAQKSKKDFAGSLNLNLQQIFKLQSLILSKNIEEVKKLSTAMREEWGEVSIFHSLMGNHYYLIGNFQEAIRSYKQALLLDPENMEAKSMLLNLR